MGFQVNLCCYLGGQGALHLYHVVMMSVLITSWPTDVMP